MCGRIVTNVINVRGCVIRSCGILVSGFGVSTFGLEFGLLISIWC